MQTVGSARDNGFVRTTKDRLQELRESRTASRRKQSEAEEVAVDEYPDFEEDAEVSEGSQEADLGRGDFDEVED